MKDKIIQAIREVSIVDKTYEEYVEAVADNMMAFCVEQASFDQMTIYILDHYAKQKAMEIFEEIRGFFNEKYESVTTDCHYELLYNPIETPERMRNLGKAEMLKYLGDKIAELKKKYIGEDTNVTTKTEGEG